MSTRNSFLPIIILVGKVVGSLAAGILILLYIFQNNILYIPRPPGFPITPDENPNGCRSPNEWTIAGRLANENPSDGTIEFEENMIQTSDHEKIHTWLLLQRNSDVVPTLIYFHGNAANMGFRLQNAAEMYARAGINILMMDYRGYGRSTGNPSEAGLELDAEAVIKFASNHPRLSKSPLIVFGRSLGGAVSISLALQYPELIKGIIVENTFTSIPAMVDILMPYVSFMKHLILRIEWNSLEKIKSIKQPILFISGDSDELVPPIHMKELYDKAIHSIHRDFYSVSGGTHNDTWLRAGSTYYKRMKAFVDILMDSVDENNGSVSSINNAESTTNHDNTNKDTASHNNNNNNNNSNNSCQTNDVSNYSIPTMGKNFRVQ